MAAAEAMLFMTDACRPIHRMTEPVCIRDAAFLKFIPIADITPRPESRRIVSFVLETAPGPDQTVQAALVARTHSRKLGATRSKTHLTLSLSHQSLPEPAPPSRLENSGPAEVSSDRIYADLIRFGPAFQNLRQKLFLGRHWIEGTVWGGEENILNHLPDVLGSPFPFDAAMQAACVWGQYFNGIVAFPEGLAQRFIYRKTQPGRLYRICLALRKIAVDHFRCDGWIMTSAGGVCEAFMGLNMRDLSRGRLKVPSWVGPSRLKTPFAE